MDRYDNPKERERDFKDVLETLEDEELWTESNTLRELFGLKDKEIERLRGAVEFYAPGEKWEERLNPYDDGFIATKILDDKGMVAQQALKEE